MPGLTIPYRFRGPSRSGNGGYVCGRIAAYADGPATVTLRQPPPLATPLAVERDDAGSLRIRHGRALIAEAASSAGPPARRYRARSPWRKLARRPAARHISGILSSLTALSAG